MVLTHHGGQCFKVTFGDLTIAFDPPGKDSKSLKINKFGADIVFISKNHTDMNGIEQVTHGEREPFVISGPGEYEVRGVRARGFQAKSLYGGSEGITTLYLIELEGMTLLFLGSLNDTKLPHDLEETLDKVHVLFMPIGGEGVLSAQDAHKLSVKLESHITIPMHFDGVGEKSALGTFLKADGSDAKPVEKATLKQKDVEKENGTILVLASQ
jgi:L-ascorbate metabolism protein UlaG (beta-lactamase superfamily)